MWNDEVLVPYTTKRCQAVGWVKKWFDLHCGGGEEQREMRMMNEKYVKLKDARGKEIRKKVYIKKRKKKEERRKNKKENGNGNGK